MMMIIESVVKYGFIFSIGSAYCGGRYMRLWHFSSFGWSQGVAKSETSSG